MIVWLFTLITLAAPVQLQNAFSGEFSVDVKGSGSEAIIFVHDYASDKRNFAYLSRKLASRKMTTVNVELSGHGKRSNVEMDAPFLHLEIRTVIEYLQAQGVSEIQCVGEGFGGILCLQAISEKTPLHQVSIISPVALLHHQRLLAHIDAYTSHRPLFIIVSSGDSHGIRTTSMLEERMEVVVHEVGSDLRGVSLIRENPELERLLVKWIYRVPDTSGTWESLPTIKVQKDLDKVERSRFILRSFKDE